MDLSVQNWFSVRQHIHFVTKEQIKIFKHASNTGIEEETGELCSIEDMSKSYYKATKTDSTQQLVALLK